MNGMRIRDPYIMEPGVSPGRQVVKIYMPSNMTWAELTAAPVTITLVLNDKPGIGICNWYFRQFSESSPPEHPYYLLNTSSNTAPIDLALFSTDEQCCPHPQITSSPPAPPPSPPPQCMACVRVSHPYVTAPAVRLYNYCNDLATMINSSPILNSLAPCQGLQFMCDNPNASDVFGAGTLVVRLHCGLHYGRSPANILSCPALSLLCPAKPVHICKPATELRHWEGIRRHRIYRGCNCKVRPLLEPSD